MLEELLPAHPLLSIGHQ